MPSCRQLSFEDFLHGPDGGVRKGEVVCSIHVPVPQQHDYFWSHKVGLTSNCRQGLILPSLSQEACLTPLTARSAQCEAHCSAMFAAW